MKALILLLLGACQALQPGLEYQYRYSARVATGIPSLNRQFAAAGIQADVTVQVGADFTTVVQFSNVEVGDLNEILDCDLRAPLPIEYQPLQEHADLLERPFRVIMNESGIPNHMEGPQEPVWISNIRKAFVNIFRVPLFWNTESHAIKLNYGAVKESLVGRCQNWYSSLKFPANQAAKINQQREHFMEEDVQRDAYSSSYTTKTKSKTSKTSKTSKSSRTSKTGKTSPGHLSNVPQIEDTLWSVRRTTDFDMCENLVSLQIHSSKYTEEVIQRSSVASYLIRGDTHRRIEQAVLEGSISVITNKERHEHVDTFTNQTLELKVVREVGQPITVGDDVHPYYSWHYDIERPQGDEFVPLEQVITGRPITGQIVNAIVEYIKKTVDDLSHRMERFPAKPENLAYIIGRLVEAVANLDYQHIQTLYNHFESQSTLHKYIFTQLVIFAGTEPSVTFAVDNIREPQFKTAFYSIIDVNVRNPAPIPKILNLLLSEEEGLPHSIGLMNFANLANKACLGEDKKHFYFDYSCGPKSSCDPELIISTFIPYLVRGLGNQETDIWQRLTYLQALSNLGTPQTINVLKPIILGVTETNVFMRTNAIWSLSAYNMHKSALSQIYEILMPIIENKGEQFEIRNIAFLTLATWGPGSSWWQQLAVSTWHDPSPQFANFVTTTIYSIARSHTKLAETVSRVERLCKPAAPASVLHSTNFFLHEYLFSAEHGSRVNFAWFASIHGAIPEEVFLRLQTEFFYGYTKVTKIDAQQRGLFHLVQIMRQAMAKPSKKPQSSAQEIVAGMWEELKEKIGFSAPETDSQLQLWLKLDRIIYLTIESDFKGGPYIPHLLDQVTTGLFHSLPQFDRDLNTFIALPTEIGIPFSVQYIAEDAIWLNINNGPEYSITSGKIKGNVGFIFDSSQVQYVDARTHLPWSNRPAVASGLYADTQLVLPLNVHASIDSYSQEIQLSIEPTNTEKIDVIKFEFVPYTVLENNYPSDVLVVENEYKPILHGEVPLFNDKHQAFPSDVGLWVEVATDGDVHHTPSIYEIISQLFSTSTSMHTWEQNIVFDPTLSTTKTVSFTFTYVSTGSSGSLTDRGDYDDGQVSQNSDYELGQFSQVQGGVDQDLLEVDSFGTQSQTRERIVRLQQALIVSGGHVRTVSVEVELKGTPTRNYEASVTWAISSSASARSSKVQVTLMKHPAVGVLEEAHTICLNAQIVKPHFNPFFTIEDVLTANYHSTVKAELYDGVTCEEASVLSLEASFDVSNVAIERVKEAIDKSCDYSTYAPGIDIITSPLYDHSHITATWTPDFPDYLKNLTYYVDDLIKLSLSKHIEFDHTTAHYDARVEIDATKCIETGLWTVRTEKPYAVSIIKELEIPVWVNPFFTPAPLATTLLYDLAVGRTPVSCTVEETKVRTFDAKEFAYEPSECWNAMSIDMSPNERGALLVRYTGQWEVRIIWNAEALVIDMTPTNFIVNGEPAQGTDNRYTVLHHEDSHTIVFESGTRIKVSDKVELLMAMYHRGHTAGLCGNFDGEPSNDMVGPKGCYYTDSSLFALSWASPGEGCASFIFSGKKRKVEQYQDICTHFTYEPTGVTHSDALYDCTEWVYHERTEGHYHCKALTPMPVCRPECVANSPITTSVEYECKFTGHHQQAQQQQQQVEGTQWDECFPHSYTLTYPSSCVPH
ncbi:hemolymph clottable protein-like [Penaeus japonicus]|uniref:hemolymph clottable protein-like n=1 Tax=Penaeus japonicus TaxID=27405 RepID=UPI001C70DFDF|nr:hemolymph clottable protein-like [Penaeus japonicus]